MRNPPYLGGFRISESGRAVVRAGKTSFHNELEPFGLATVFALHNGHVHSGGQFLPKLYLQARRGSVCAESHPPPGQVKDGHHGQFSRRIHPHRLAFGWVGVKHYRTCRRSASGYRYDARIGMGIVQILNPEPVVARAFQGGGINVLVAEQTAVAKCFDRADGLEIHAVGAAFHQVAGHVFFRRWPPSSAAPCRQPNARQSQ